jgi:peroxiredoxin
MTFFRTALYSLALGISLGISFSRPALGQAGNQNPNEPDLLKPKVLSQGAGGGSLQAINDDYNRRLLQLERQRLEQMGQLAARQTPQEAADTYVQLFRLAIVNNLFTEAEPIADQVLKSTDNSPVVQVLAQTINVIAAADRGAYDESLADLRHALGDKSAGNRPGEAPAPATILDTPALLALCDAYYQRLVQGNQFEAARKAFRLVLDKTENPAVKGFCTSRLFRLDLIGKPAPPIVGTDLDGKPVSLAELKGNAVLIVFWASWCMPNSAECVWLDQVYTSHQKRGLRVLGINLDIVQNGGTPIETVMPNIRRFVLDHNIRWPNLINGVGAHDYASAYGVAEIPSNVLIGRDGNIIHIDLSRKNLDSVITRAVGP